MIRIATIIVCAALLCGCGHKKLYHSFNDLIAACDAGEC